MKVISIINLKGGVGKTTTVIQMAYYLKEMGNKVLLLDNDKQGNLSKFFGRYNDLEESGMARLLRGSEKRLSMLVKSTQYPGIDIINANMELLTATVELTRTNAEDQHLRIQKMLGEIKAAGYEYVIIDNPPDIGLNVINAMVVTDDVIVPLKVDSWSMEGMDIIIRQIDNAKAFRPKIKLAGILITNYRNNDTNAAGISWLKKMGYKLFDTNIRYSEKAAESIFFNKTAREYSPRSAVAIDYKKLTKEYLERSGRHGTK